LNVIVLQVAVLEQQNSDNSQRELAEIRRQAGLIKDLVQRLQEYRRGRPVAVRAVDLNALVRNEVAAMRSPAGAFRIELTDDRPPVPGPITALRRLVSFLLTNAVAAAAGRGDVTVRTVASPGQVVLTVADGGGDVDPERLNQFFEPCAPGREGTNGLELA